MTYADAGSIRRSPRPEVRTVGALIGVASGAVLLGVSFLPWIHYGSHSVNAWTNYENQYEVVIFGAGFTWTAVLVGVVATVWATALVADVFARADPTRGGPEPSSRRSAGIILIAGGAFVVTVSFVRGLAVAFYDSGDGGSFQAGVGMHAAWLAAVGLVVAGGLHIRDARRLRAEHAARPFIPVGGAVLAAMSGLVLLGSSFLLEWFHGPGGRDYDAWSGIDRGYTILAVTIGVYVAASWVAVVFSASRSARAPRPAVRLTVGLMSLAAGVLVLYLVSARFDSLNDLARPDALLGNEYLFHRGFGILWAWVAGVGLLAGGIVELTSSLASTMKGAGTMAAQRRR